MLNIKELREERELQQKDVAAILNRTAACVSSWETGKTEPAIEDLKRLATLFQTSIDYLVGFSDDCGNTLTQCGFTPVTEKIVDLLRSLGTEEQYQVLGFVQALHNQSRPFSGAPLPRP